MPDFQGKAEPVTLEGLQKALEMLNLKVPELLAVITVETSGCGFEADRRPVILFERHIFSQHTGGRFDATHPDISNPKAGGYAFGAGEYPRLQAAIQLERTAALMSASWGVGQVMGFNFKAAGFPDVETMVAAMMESEDKQLLAMTNFLISSNLHRALAVHDWTSFARGYNGSDFARNQYDLKLSSAFHRFQQGPLPDIVVRTGQLLLSYAGLKVGGVDGIIGRMTRNAAQLFREAHKLGDSDEVNEELLAAVRATL